MSESQNSGKRKGGSTKHHEPQKKKIKNKESSPVASKPINYDKMKSAGAGPSKTGEHTGKQSKDNNKPSSGAGKSSDKNKPSSGAGKSSDKNKPSSGAGKSSGNKTPPAESHSNVPTVDKNKPASGAGKSSDNNKPSSGAGKSSGNKTPAAKSHSNEPTVENRIRALQRTQTKHTDMLTIIQQQLDHIQETLRQLTERKRLNRKIVWPLISREKFDELEKELVEGNEDLRDVLEDKMQRAAGTGTDLRKFLRTVVNALFARTGKFTISGRRGTSECVLNFELGRMVLDVADSVFEAASRDHIKDKYAKALTYLNDKRSNHKAKGNKTQGGSKNKKKRLNTKKKNRAEQHSGNESPGQISRTSESSRTSRSNSSSQRDEQNHGNETPATHGDENIEEAIHTNEHESLKTKGNYMKGGSTNKNNGSTHTQKNRAEHSLTDQLEGHNSPGYISRSSGSRRTSRSNSSSQRDEQYNDNGTQAAHVDENIEEDIQSHEDEVLSDKETATEKESERDTDDEFARIKDYISNSQHMTNPLTPQLISDDSDLD